MIEGLIILVIFLISAQILILYILINRIQNLSKELDHIKGDAKVLFAMIEGLSEVRDEPKEPDKEELEEAKEEDILEINGFEQLNKLLIGEVDIDEYSRK